MSPLLQFSVLPPLPPSTDKSHHLANSAGFRNPWPSFSQRGTGPFTILKARYGPSRPDFIPVPEDRNELVQIRKPDFTPPRSDKDGKSQMKVTWIGHASFLIQCSPSAGSTERGINILLDPVFSDRTSPFSFIGPKRYTPTPCTLQELCAQVPIDIICISHNHYDHADVATLTYLFEEAEREQRELVCCVGLGNGRWLTPLIPAKAGGRIRVWEGDWWERIEVGLGGDRYMSKSGTKTETSCRNSRDATNTQNQAQDSTTTLQSGEKHNSSSQVRVTIAPSQHASARTPFDRDCDLWGSFAIELPPYSESQDLLKESAASTHNLVSSTPDSRGPSLFFSGDTAYRTTFPSDLHTNTQDLDWLSPTARESYPHCPAFAQIGAHIGPFTLSLLPIGLTRPRSFMSNVHADSRDSICMHRDVKSKRSIGMHWGTVRGGISGQYEDVRIPPREWEEAGREVGLKWRGTYKNGRSTTLVGDNREGKKDENDWEIGLVDIGESLTI